MKLRRVVESRWNDDTGCYVDVKEYGIVMMMTSDLILKRGHHAMLYWHSIVLPFEKEEKELKDLRS